MCAAVQAGVEVLGRGEQQVSVDGDVILPTGAEVARDDRRLGGLGDVPHLEPVKVALDDVMAREREVGVHVAEIAEVRGIREDGRLGRGRDELEIPGGGGGVQPPGAEADARVGARRRGGGPGPLRAGSLYGGGGGAADRGAGERGSHWWAP